MNNHYFLNNQKAISTNKKASRDAGFFVYLSGGGVIQLGHTIYS
jgi:hypothetical protein